MTYYKNYIILFGGFQDTSQQTRYLQDLWIYDCQKFTWHNPSLAPASQKPDPRSSFSFVPHQAGALLFGGYSRVKTPTSGGGKAVKGGPQRLTLRPMIYQDAWFLRISPPAADAPDSTGPTVRWERRKRPANLPNPARAGCTMAYHKGRGITFGGVHDVEASEEGIDSQFFDSLFAWNVERNRFFQLNLRRPKFPGRKLQPTPAMKSKDRSKADEEELLQNLASLEARRGIHRERDKEMDVGIPKILDTVEPGKSEVIRFEMPHPRFNSQLAVQDDSLFILGGTFERGDREFTFNDMYSVDLVKLDGIKEIFYNEPVNWNIKDQDESEEDEDDDEEDGDIGSDEEPMSICPPSPAPADLNVPLIAHDMEQLDVEELEIELTIKDNQPHPRPFENLREFFNRTSNEWQNVLIDRLTKSGHNTEKTVKEVRKEAFDLAEEKWWDSREEIMALEDEQEAAGIGEVVNIAERGDLPSNERRR